MSCLTIPMNESILIYTDGSCLNGKGAWGAIIIIEMKKIVVKGLELDTTHQRMELTAVLKAVEYLFSNDMPILPINIYTDSQYVAELAVRKEKLKAKFYLTNQGSLISNVDLVKPLVELIERHHVQFVKVKAHQKKEGSENLNREVDMLVRKLVRGI